MNNNKAIMLKEEYFDEPFFDRLFRSIGGERFECLYEVNDQDGEESADYMLADMIFELKFIEQEFLSNPDRVEKLSESAKGISDTVGSGTVLLGSDEIPEKLMQKQNDQYFESLKSRIRKARKQIKSSRKIVGSEQPGVLFLVNKGCYTTNHSELFEYVEGYLKRKAPEIDYLYLFSALPQFVDGCNRMMLLTRHSRGADEIEKVFMDVGKGLKEEMERTMGTTIPTAEGAFGAARTMTSDLQFPSKTGSLTIKCGIIKQQANQAR